MKGPSFYFRWLQHDNPAGGVERFPELKSNFETSVPGIYCVGDLTGIPLVKPAAESGYDLVGRLHEDSGFQKERQGNRDGGILDLVIAGGGPAGVAAGLRARELGYRFVIIESARLFSTIADFPRGKPILVTPEGPVRGPLRFSDGTRETLLEELKAAVAGRDLPVREGETVVEIAGEPRGFTVRTSAALYRALRVIVAIGKSGNARRLGVPGEDRDKVFSRLIDPGSHRGEDILVVGGGDSAVEAAVALARAGNRVTLSYRRAELSRPKEQNLENLRGEVEKGRIVPLLGSRVEEVLEESAVLGLSGGGRKTIPNDAVYALIGTEIPIRFFERSRIRMEGEMRFPDYAALAALLLFSAALYFGKSGPQTPVSGIGGFFALPARLVDLPWVSMTKGLLAWLGFLGMIVTGPYLLFRLVRSRKELLTGPWPAFKYGYYLIMFAAVGILYTARCLRGVDLLGWTMNEWYTALYALTILVFGLRRIRVRPTGYIRRQTITLIVVQWLPLFLLPAVVLPYMGAHGLIPPWVAKNVFPGGSYWRAFGFVLAWPLLLWNLASGSPYTFWLVLSLVQTFAIIPYVVYRWGKGAYCGWICSCGALAETLGDEYRAKAPHGQAAKRLENWGQVVLWFAVILTVLVASGAWFGKHFGVTPVMRDLYTLIVDVIFAGVLGVGVYFFLSGRVWCRFLCPLAALMHIFARFSVYRIRTDKKRCISCNICTKVCHMGIDVMGYASKGIPMNDAQCVRCSACIVDCPVDALAFGRVRRSDPANREFLKEPIPLAPGWRSGLPKDRIDGLIAREREKAAEE